ncbi:hypothetical protein IG631_14323 [Alternaria alternata]|nr:hypothetical protein IG631_14323 [Alternaria alternata]
MKLKSCGHPIVTECPKTTSQQNYIRALYDEGILAIFEGIGSMVPKERLANENQADRDILSCSPRPQSSRNENGEDIALQSKASSSGFKYGDESRASQLSLKNQGRRGKKNDPVIRFLYMCYPSSRGRGLREVPVMSDGNLPRDGVLIKDLKRWYYSQRTFLQRLRTLRDFSTIHLQIVSATVLRHRCEIADPS